MRYKSRFLLDGIKMEFNDVIRKRTATRKFSDKKVSQEVIIKILDAGNLVSTAKNFQPHSYMVFFLKKA